MTAAHVAPRLGAASLEAAGAFVQAAGLVIGKATASGVTGHVDLGPDHHTPWGIVHGGVYATAIESAASVGASLAVRGAGQVAVGLTNTTHFLRSLISGRARVEAVALHQGRTQQLWQVNITDQAGRLIAHGEVRLQNVTAQPAQGNGETHEDDVISPGPLQSPDQTGETLHEDQSVNRLRHRG